MRFTSFLLVACVLACGKDQAPQEGAVPPISHASTIAPLGLPDQAALLRGDLPRGPEMSLLQERCQICHTLDYVTQQRLTEAQWAKTLTKMQKWGSPITDDEVKRLGPYLAATWPNHLPDRVSARVQAPGGR